MVFSLMGAIIVVLLLIPSLSLLVLKPQHAPEQKESPPLIPTVLDYAGRIGCIVALLFSSEEFGRLDVNMWLPLVYVFLLLYYVCWLRYLYGGRTHYLLYKPLLRIPVPMAVFPALMFLCAGLWCGSLLLVFMSLVFAAGHITNAWLIYKKNYGQ